MHLFAVAENPEFLARAWKRQEPRRSAVCEGGLCFGVISRDSPTFKPVSASLSRILLSCFLIFQYQHIIPISDQDQEALKGGAVFLGSVAGAKILEGFGSKIAPFGIVAMAGMYCCYKMYRVVKLHDAETLKKSKSQWDQFRKLYPTLVTVPLGTNTIRVYRNTNISKEVFSQYLSDHAKLLINLLPMIGMHQTINLFIGEKSKTAAGWSYRNEKGEVCIAIAEESLNYPAEKTAALWGHECAHHILGHCNNDIDITLVERMKALYNKGTFDVYYEKSRKRELDANLYNAALLGGSSDIHSYHAGTSQLAQEAQEKMASELGSCSLMYWPWYRFKNKFFPLENTHPEDQEIRAGLNKFELNKIQFIRTFFFQKVSAHNALQHQKRIAYSPKKINKKLAHHTHVALSGRRSRGLIPYLLSV